MTMIRLWMVSMMLCASSTWAAEDHALLGRWRVDVSMLDTPSPPKAVHITLERAAPEALRMSVDITNHDDSVAHAESTFPLDGTATAARGSLDVDVVSMTTPDRRTLVMGASMRGHPSNTRVFTAEADGQHMVETIVRHGPDGKPSTRINRWTRESPPK